MSEIALALESAPQSLQLIGLLVPAIGCCMAKLAKPVASEYFTSRNYFKLTGTNLLNFLRKEFEAHDHPFGGKNPGRNQYAVVIPIQDAEETILVDKNNLEPVNVLREGDIIPGTSDRHRHDGKGFKGPWEH
jgi:hypothetical protein